MTVGGGQSCTVAHPSALTDTWDLRYGAPLISPTRAPKEYLLCILISSLTGTLPLQETWAAQVLSALSWAQLAMLSGYRRMTVMRALHKAVPPPRGGCKTLCAPSTASATTSPAPKYSHSKARALAHKQRCLEWEPIHGQGNTHRFSAGRLHSHLVRGHCTAAPHRGTALIPYPTPYVFLCVCGGVVAPSTR